MSEEYLQKWKIEIDRKTERANFSFWHGKDGIKGKKEEMEEQEKQELWQCSWARRVLESYPNGPSSILAGVAYTGIVLAAICNYSLSNGDV